MSYNLKNKTMFDTGAAIIVLGIVALIVLPFIVRKAYKKSRDLNFLKEFNSLAEKEKIVISQKEVWNNCYAIGIDNNSGKLYYIKKQKEKVEDVLIDLSDVDKCTLVNINKTVNNSMGRSNMSDRIELIFTFRKSGLPEKVLEFYSNTEFMPTEKDQSQAENWLQLINSDLKGRKS
jgi:hypothetical protein